VIPIEVARRPLRYGKAFGTKQIRDRAAPPCSLGVRTFEPAEAATSTKKAAETAATKTTKTAAKKTVKKAAKKTVKKAAKKTTKKAAKKTVKKATKRASRAKVPTRRKIVWAVGKPGLNAVSTWEYRDKAHAEKEAKKHGEGFMVMAVRVPMEDPEPPEAEAAADAAAPAAPAADAKK
jgi:hypothetical protein